VPRDAAAQSLAPITDFILPTLLSLLHYLLYLLYYTQSYYSRFHTQSYCGLKTTSCSTLRVRNSFTYFTALLTLLTLLHAIILLNQLLHTQGAQLLDLADWGIEVHGCDRKRGLVHEQDRLDPRFDRAQHQCTAVGYRVLRKNKKQRFYKAQHQCTAVGYRVLRGKKGRKRRMKTQGLIEPNTSALRLATGYCAKKKNLCTAMGYRVMREWVRVCLCVLVRVCVCVCGCVCLCVFV